MRANRQREGCLLPPPAEPAAPEQTPAAWEPLHARPGSRGPRGPPAPPSPPRGHPSPQNLAPSVPPLPPHPLPSWPPGCSPPSSWARPWPSPLCRGLRPLCALSTSLASRGESPDVLGRGSGPTRADGKGSTWLPQPRRRAAPGLCLGHQVLPLVQGWHLRSRPPSKGPAGLLGRRRWGCGGISVPPSAGAWTPGRRGPRPVPGTPSHRTAHGRPPQTHIRQDQGLMREHGQRWQQPAHRACGWRAVSPEPTEPAICPLSPLPPPLPSGRTERAARTSPWPAVLTLQTLEPGACWPRDTSPGRGVPWGAPLSPPPTLRRGVRRAWGDFRAKGWVGLGSLPLKGWGGNGKRGMNPTGCPWRMPP